MHQQLLESSLFKVTSRYETMVIAWIKSNDKAVLPLDAAL